MIEKNITTKSIRKTNVIVGDPEFAKALMWTRAIIYSYSLGLRAHEN